MNTRTLSIININCINNINRTNDVYHFDNINSINDSHYFDNIQIFDVLKNIEIKKKLK